MARPKGFPVPGSTPSPVVKRLPVNRTFEPSVSATISQLMREEASSGPVRPSNVMVSMNPSANPVSSPPSKRAD